VKPDRLFERQQIDWLALLHEGLTVEGSVADIENRFANYSFGNRILLRVQERCWILARSPARRSTAHAPTSPYPPELAAARRRLEQRRCPVVACRGTDTSGQYQLLLPTIAE
jgi:hypothetical protein